MTSKTHEAIEAVVCIYDFINTKATNEKWKGPDVKRWAGYLESLTDLLEEVIDVQK